MGMTPEETFLFLKIVMTFCYCITFIVGTIGNGLVIWISGFRMKTVSSVWFLNLAIADFIFCLFLPIRVFQWLFDSDYLFYTYDVHLALFLCNLFLLAINSIVSVTFLTVISVHRCVSIMCPLWAKIHCTRRLAKVASVFYWIIPLIYIIPIHLSPFYVSAANKMFYLLPPSYFKFLYIYSNSSSYKPDYNFIFISSINNSLTFWIPFIIILICNCLIIYKLRSNPFRRPKAFHRTFRLIIAVVVCFFVCWFPVNIWPVIVNMMDIWNPLVNILVINVCFCLISISSCMNPILYVLLGHSRGSNSRRSIRVRMENAINDFK